MGHRPYHIFLKCLMEFYCKLSFLFAFRVTYPNAVCVSLRSNKRVECASQVTSSVAFDFSPCFETRIVYIHVFLLAVLFPNFVGTLLNFLGHYCRYLQISGMCIAPCVCMSMCVLVCRRTNNTGACT